MIYTEEKTTDASVQELVGLLKKAVAQPANRGVPKNAPAVVNNYGEGADGFQLYRFAKSVTAKPGTEQFTGRSERDLIAKFSQVCFDKGYRSDKAPDGAMMLPINFACLPDSVLNDPATQALRQAMDAGRPDEDQFRWEAKKFVKAGTGILSAYQGGLGGDLVAPPAFGPFIDIYRNESVLNRAGCTNYPIPAQGSVYFPSQTDVTTAVSVGEGGTATATQVATGNIELNAKEFRVHATINQRADLMSSGFASQLLNQDMAKSLALKVDYDGLYGTGGTNAIQGLLYRFGAGRIFRYMGAGVGANGNTYRAEDAANMASIIEANNFDLKGWIMHPFLRRFIQNLRSDAVSAADGAGLFLFNLMRDWGQTGPKELQGAPMYVSNQVNRTRTKGSGTTLTTLFGGDFSQVVQGMYGAMQIESNPYDSTAWLNNQLLFRGIAYADVTVKREGGLIIYDQLNAGSVTGFADATTSP